MPIYGGVRVHLLHRGKLRRWRSIWRGWMSADTMALWPCIFPSGWATAASERQMAGRREELCVPRAYGTRLYPREPTRIQTSVVSMGGCIRVHLAFWSVTARMDAFVVLGKELIALSDYDRRTGLCVWGGCWLTDRSVGRDRVRLIDVLWA